jgi:hypothetical protein
MARGKTVAALVAAAGIAGVVIWRRRSRQRDHVDLYFADGSMVSFSPGSPEAGKLLPIAESMLGALNGNAAR